MRKKAKPARHGHRAIGEAFPMPEAMDCLRQVRGDIIFGVLFLPIAFTYQKLIENATLSVSSFSFVKFLNLLPDLVILGLLLFTYIMEVIVISLVILNPKGYPSMGKKIILATLTLIFIIAVTMMGQIGKSTERYMILLFKTAYVCSIITSFGQLYLAGWNETSDDIGHRKVLLFCVPFSIAIILWYYPFVEL